MDAKAKCEADGAILAEFYTKEDHDEMLREEIAFRRS